MRTYDAVSLRPCSVRLNVPDGPADNPQQAEEASHIGHQGNHFCRRCFVGGTNKDKECPDGYHSFYEVSIHSRNFESCIQFFVDLAWTASKCRGYPQLCPCANQARYIRCCCSRRRAPNSNWHQGQDRTALDRNPHREGSRNARCYPRTLSGRHFKLSSGVVKRTD